MEKNINALRLAGLLTEEEASRYTGMYVEQDPSGGDPSGAPAPAPSGAGEGGGDAPEDPAALLDQAIELLNKVKGLMGGGDKAGPGGPPAELGTGSPPPM